MIVAEFEWEEHYDEEVNVTHKLVAHGVFGKVGLTIAWIYPAPNQLNGVSAGKWWPEVIDVRFQRGTIELDECDTLEQAKQLCIKELANN